jgi:hypothetical protein
VRGLDFVEGAFFGIFDCEEQDVVGPTESEGCGRFSRWCLANYSGRQFPRRLLGESERRDPAIGDRIPHVFKVSAGEATSKLGGQASGQMDQGFFTIDSAVSTLLIVLDDEAADSEVCENLQGIDASKRIAVRGENKGNIERSRVLDGLLHAAADRIVIILGFDQSDGNVRLVIKNVIGALRLAAGYELATYNDPALGKTNLFTNLPLDIPTGVDDCGRNILRANVAFAEVSFIHARQQLEEPAGSKHRSYRDGSSGNTNRSGWKCARLFRAMRGFTGRNRSSHIASLAC